MWFTGKEEVDHVSYHVLARNPIIAITKDPSILFKFVETITDCMCGGTCGGCEVVYVDFLELIIECKSMKESDLVDIQGLDWFKLSTRLPLSIPTLEKYSDNVDWKGISESYTYIKTEELIRKFHKKLDMKHLYNVNLKQDVLSTLIFEENILPLRFSTSLPRDVLLSNIKENVEFISRFVDNTTFFISIFGAETTEQTFINTSGALRVDPKVFAKNCYKTKYIPKTKRFLDILKKGVNWFEFLPCCKPDVAFIDEHIVPGASKETWYDISTHPHLTNCFIEKYKSHLDMKKVSQYHEFDTETLKQILGNWDTEYGSISIYKRLPPEFIDEFADKLDWYNLCEHQVLPEWLLNKHKIKLNWGQISMYQNLSQTFIEENRNMLNMIKLSKNKTIRHSSFW